ncbi:MAG TPA: glycogen debranching N-terminal domain-containing protein [Anaeromyxobacter sp.]|nr:glycogen debranching N-terminal domain-containing protein [Anaeromyxobacter sp.]
MFGYADPSQQPEATGVDKLVLKRSNLFLVANRLGDVSPAGARDLGLFLTDTRHLSGWRLLVQGGPPLCLSSQVSTDYVSQIDFTITGLHEGGLLGSEPVNYVHLRRDQIIDDVFVDRFVLTNFQGRPIRQWLELEWAADFADVFEIRGARRARRGRYLVPAVEDGRVVLRYRGLDGREYVTEIRLAVVQGADGAVEVERLDGAGARLGLRLEPGESGELAFNVFAGLGDARPAPPRRFEDRAADTHRAYADWAGQCTGFTSSNEVFDRAMTQAVADLKALEVCHDGQPVISAGIPWYTCPFGRDALITGFEALLATPEMARQALRFLARLQGTRDDPERDEEPGKIPHEIRFGEMAVAGEVPHTPYYGSVDSTPLFLVLLSEYLRWTDDRELLDELLPAADRALGWMERESGPDGLLTYERRARKGLRNQGWKDSHDGVPFASGRSADPPIALVEAQGYAVDARRRMASLHAALGRGHDAARLRADADALAATIEERFWMPDRQTYALALDGGGRRVDAVTSNPGHLLFSRATSDARAEKVEASLFSREMWSGWGIRTLGKGQPAYNPLSYHDGTVWPHDNALAAMGMANYGMTRSAGRVLDGLWAAVQHFRYLRLPELFCGLDRMTGQFPVHYPVACSPQAWASAAFFLLVRACLGLFPDAGRRTLHIASPVLPEWLDHLTLHRMRIGPARATLHFTRNASGTFVAVGEVEGGPLHVRIDLRR